MVILAQIIKRNQAKRSSENVKKARIEQKEEQNTNLKRHGRDSLITFLYTSFKNKSIVHLYIQIQINIASKIKQSNSFSNDVDFTQDVTLMKQLVPCGRYVQGRSWKNTWEKNLGP